MFCCKCLNISIKSKTANLPKVDVASLSLSVLEISDPFFKEDLVEAEILNISKEQPCLVQVRNIACWIIHRCINCSIDTHALHRDKGATCVLINCNMLSEKVVIAELKSSLLYSPVFRLLVTGNIDSESFESSMGDLYAKGSMQTNLAALQRQLTEALQREAQSVEERVRQYSEKQFAGLEEFQTKAHDDYKALSRLLMERQNSNTGISQSSNQSHMPAPRSKFVSLPPPPQKFQLFQGDEVRQPMTPLNQNTTRPRESLSRRQSNPKLNMSPAQADIRPVPSVRVAEELSPETVDSEGLFQLDGMDENPPAMFHSEDETDTDADSVSHDEGIHIPRAQSAFSNLAKSLPVSVPVFPGERSHVEDPDKDSMIPLGPQDIAASIKALAQSVHGDTVFGDLPRPRFSSQI